ncbi:hypothetical protein CCP4SC76_730013 [Gammaproteobacteria bacterium]
MHNLMSRNFMIHKPPHNLHNLWADFSLTRARGFSRLYSRNFPIECEIGCVGCAGCSEGYESRGYAAQPTAQPAQPHRQWRVRHG